jgi:hypothetical protein
VATAAMGMHNARNILLPGCAGLGEEGGQTAQKEHHPKKASPANTRFPEGRAESKSGD